MKKTTFQKCRNMAIVFSAILLAAFSPLDANAALSAVSYSENFDSGSAPDFATSTVLSAGPYSSTANSWSIPSQALQYSVASGANIRGTAQVQLPDAYSLLMSGIDVIASVDIRISTLSTTNVIGGGLRMFTDASGTGSADNFFGVHGWEMNFRVPTSGGTGLRLGVYDYGGTDGAGTGDTYVAGTVSSGSLTGITFSTSETYNVIMKTHLISFPETISGGGTELDANLGKVRITASITDPSGTGSVPVTASVTGVSLATAAANSGNGQYFGVVTNNVSGAFTETFDNFNVVPEPSGFVLVGLALIGLGVAGSRKRR